jgi:molybdopterin converting factor small subunit
VRVTVKYFSLATSISGRRVEWIDLPPGSTLSALKSLLDEKYGFSPKREFFYNLNGKGVAEGGMHTCRLSDGDLVMIFPRISGG